MKRKAILKKPIKDKNIKTILLISILVGILTFLMLKRFNNNTSPKVTEIATIKAKEVVYKSITNNINQTLLNTQLFDEILVLTKNSDGEIILADYELEKAYALLKDVTKSIDTTLNEEGLLFYIPSGQFFNSVFFSNLGPKIPVKINFIGTILSNLKTKITNYGMNNALVELYVTLNVGEEIITPVNKELIEINYDVLISSKMINGRVPSFYGSTYESSSKLFNVPNEE